MNIGEPRREVKIEPLELPRPLRREDEVEEPAKPAREPAPARVPA